MYPVKKTNPIYNHIQAANISPDGIMFLDQEGNVRAVNESFANRLGYSRDKFEPRTYFQINPNFTFLAWKELWDQLETHGQVVQDAELISATGESMKVNLKGRLIHADNKQFFQVVIESEMTDCEEELYFSRYCLDKLPDMIIWLHENDTFRFYNHSFLAVTGYPEEEISRMTLEDLFPVNSLKDFKHFRESLKSGEDTIHELDLLLKNGNVLPVEAHGTLVRIMDRNLPCVIFRDIRSRKELQMQIKKQLEAINLLRLQLEEEDIHLEEEINVQAGIKDIISQSPSYQPILQQISQVASTNATVLITGETGTGKELIARAIYRMSKRSHRQWIKVNCAAIPQNLIESELFGYEKGSFTGAFQRKPGRFELADGGTLFLDEIGEIPTELQANLLRVLQDGEFERIGGTKTLKVDVRVIAATNRNLEAEVASGLFREDLYYRLNVFPIHNIPLRERKEDIPLLVSHFIEKHNRLLGRRINEISPSVMRQLKQYEYPGNVRELENLIERAMILSPGNKLLPHFQFKKNPEGGKKQFASMNEMQRLHILNALRRTNGKITGKDSAAELLKMNGKTLYARMRKLGIQRSDILS